MDSSELLPTYYLNTAMEAMEQAYARNQDVMVGTHISRAIDALHTLMHQGIVIGSSSEQGHSDPYELNEYNSAI